MRRKSHVRFWNGGGVGDRPADRNGGRRGWPPCPPHQREGEAVVEGWMVVKWVGAG